jgi:hypothetical protein
VVQIRTPYRVGAVVPLITEFARAFSSAVEQQTFNLQVEGSIPSGPTKLESQLG